MRNDIKEKIKYLIEIKNMSYLEVAKKLEIPKATIAYHAIKMGIEPAKKQYPIDKDLLINLYVNQKLSIRDVAKNLGCWEKSVLFWLKKYGIKTRPVGTNQFDIIDFNEIKQKFNDLNLECLTKEYINSSQKLKYKCKSCGYEGTKVVGQLKRNDGCNNCARKKMGLKRRINENEIKRIALEKNYTYLKSEWNEDSQRIIHYICHCGNEHSKLWANFKRENNCVKCKSLRYKGENNHNWNPDLTEEDRLQLGRYEEGYKAWRCEIFKKYKHKCDICGSKKNKQVHHLESYANNKHLRTDINNGVCLCKDCHVEFHQNYGFGDNNQGQYFDFKNKNLRINLN